MSLAGSTPSRPAVTPLYDEVRTTVEEAIVAVVGRPYWEECTGGDPEAALRSTFAEDIELESMEVMEIAERLIDHYAGRVDFVAWFSDMELEEMVELTVGHVVHFVVASLSGRGDQAARAVTGGSPAPP
jgi:acyl carrier protein